MKKLLYAFLLVMSASIFVVQAKAQVIVIANPSVRVSDVSKSDLVEVFTGASSSLRGSHAVPVLLTESVHHEQFLREYIAKSNSLFMGGWRSLVLSGQAVMPKTLPNDTAVVEFVAHTQGAIGYIGNTSPHEGVKVLNVR